MIFVDTSAWFAASVPSDPNFPAAASFLATTDSATLVTTDYVLDEYLTLLKIRGEAKRVSTLGRRILEEDVCRLEWVQPHDVYKAWTIFESYRDKGWSFTDCVSRTVIERLKLRICVRRALSRVRQYYGCSKRQITLGDRQSRLDLV